MCWGWEAITVKHNLHYFSGINGSEAILQVSQTYFCKQRILFSVRNCMGL